jgi:transcription antitermination factor NusG
VSDISWFAIYLGEPKREMDARNAILRLGMESFVPVEMKWAERRPGVSKLKVRRAYPLCIRYAFVGFPPTATWRDLLVDHPEYDAKVISGTQITARPVGMTLAKPTQLTAQQIADLAALSDRNVPYAASENPHKANLEVQKGQVAKILNPAFYGHFGRVDEVMVNRARVVIEFLGSMRPVEVRLDELEAA